MKVIEIPFIKYKWYYSLILRELRWYLLLIPHLQKNTTTYETNDCHLFAANACAHSAREKQTLKLSVWTLSPWIEAPQDISLR